jgi:hypothetical protein
MNIFSSLIFLKSETIYVAYNFLNPNFKIVSIF